MHKEMKDYGMIRVAAAVPRVKVADVAYNFEGICRMVDEAEAKDASIVVFPELSVTGYTCGDLFAQELLLQQAEDAVGRIAVRTTSCSRFQKPPVTRTCCMDSGLLMILSVTFFSICCSPPR